VSVLVLTLAAVAVLALLIVVAVGGRRRSRPAATAPAPAPPPAPRGKDRDIAVMTFPHLDGAERAYADALDADREAPWLREIAFVECHRHGYLLIRGTFAGRYLDVDERDQEGPLAQELRADVPEGSSALVLFAPPDDVTAMGEALARADARVVRHPLSEAAVGVLEASVADAPVAAQPPRVA
jgi:hypothetical protein